MYQEHNKNRKNAGNEVLKIIQQNNREKVVNSFTTYHYCPRDFRVRS